MDSGAVASESAEAKISGIPNSLKASVFTFCWKALAGPPVMVCKAPGPSRTVCNPALPAIPKTRLKTFSVLGIFPGLP
mgnify:CR=1 FL=1